MNTPDKPDFSDVQTTVKSTEEQRPDFSDVQTTVTSTEEIVGGAPAQQSYTIEHGDTLSAIAKRFYGKAKFWSQIFEANRDVIEDADRIFPGQTIKLPAIDVDGDGDLDDPHAG